MEKTPTLSKANFKGIYSEMARRPKRADRDNHDRWLVSYADFITLLFAFFVVMYAISSVNETKYRDFSNALTQAFSTLQGDQAKARQGMAASPGKGAESVQDKPDQVLVDRKNARLAEEERKREAYLKQLTSDLKRVLSPLVDKGQVSVTQTGRGIVLDINVKALFHEGEAVLQPGATKTLDNVAQVLKANSLAIEVVGHTDNVPIKTPRYPSNWELSSARACSVVRLFIREGLESGRLTAAGVADNSPLVPNDNPEDRAKNRRVTVTILTPQISASEGAGSNLPQ